MALFYKMHQLGTLEGQLGTFFEMMHVAVGGIFTCVLNNLRFDAIGVQFFLSL